MCSVCLCFTINSLKHTHTHTHTHTHWCVFPHSPHHTTHAHTHSLTHMHTGSPGDLWKFQLNVSTWIYIKGHTPTLPHTHLLPHIARHIHHAHSTKQSPHKTPSHSPTP